MITSYFSLLNPAIVAVPMTLPAIFASLAEDRALGRRVALVTPASPGYDFGAAQVKMLGVCSFVRVGFVCFFMRERE